MAPTGPSGCSAGTTVMATSFSFLLVFLLSEWQEEVNYAQQKMFSSLILVPYPIFLLCKNSPVKYLRTHEDVLLAQ